MNDLVKENIELLKEMYHNKKIEINFEFSGSLELFADRNMINTGVRNLLTNAVKFTNDKGKVLIELTKEENEILLKVKDSGIGISKEDKDKLFSIDGHFIREGTGGEAGTGLGLLLCKEYIAKNNGGIWVDSKVNEGSTFQIALPVKS